ncbi:MAG: outer membrane protein assembly factor BamA [Rhodospirillaceae bacterium]|nr:outer membrane protein assembly factor BamA [Rhodospirillaceae bacterium]
MLALLSGAAVVALPVTEVRAQSATDTIQGIAVQGSQRIEPATVRTYVTVREGDPFDPARIDQSLKNLFGTGLFADVSITRGENNVLVIRVVENPIINRISLEGNDKIKDEDLNKEMQLRPRVVYTRNKVQQDVEKILELYRRKGRFAARVDPKVIELPQNRVDVVFEISEGSPTYVRTINFVGNESFDDDELRNVVLTREERWWRFLTSNDTYDPDRMNYDRELLRRHYVQSGYADFEVISAVAELAPNRENFYMTFTVKEGPRYRLNKVDLEVAIKDLPRDVLESAVIPQSGDWFNGKAIEDTIDGITDAAGTAGYAFVDINPRVRRNEADKTIDLTFQVQEGPRVFVERVDLKGNVRTLDRVIRREMRLVEGDAFNTARVRRSRERLENLGFFKQGTVKIDNAASDVYPDRTILTATVEEQPTGELSFGVGYSSASGALFDVGVRERNLLGKGQNLGANFSLAQQQMQVNLSFTEPYFLDRQLVAGFDLVASQVDYRSQSGFTSNTLGGTARIGFSYNEHLFQRFNYQVFVTKLTGLTSFSSQFVREQAGSAVTSQVSQVIGYDRRDNVIDPHNGYYLTLSTDLAGLGGSERYVRGGVGGAMYMEPLEGWIFSAAASASYIVGLGQEVKIYQRSQMGGTTLRGFKDFGASPRDATTFDAVGGDWMSTASFQLRVPGLPKESGLKTYLFNDWGVIGPPKDLKRRPGITIFDTQKFRGSAGIGVEWTSPVGVITVDYSPFIFNAQPFDQKSRFRINFGQRY